MATTNRDPEPLQGSSPGFVHDQCLFCDQASACFDDNLSHMKRAHSFVVPSMSRLAVHLETLLSYLHLVITEYKECICCGTERSTAHAARQHMLDKGHCRFDIADGSEYADFYEFDNEGIGNHSDEGCLRLPSGRIVLSRYQPETRALRLPQNTAPNDWHLSPSRRNRTAGAPMAMEMASTGSAAAGTPETLPRQLTRSLRVGDARALSHLSIPERMAVLATEQKQVAKAQRVQQRYRSRVEGQGNMFLMTHFVKDAADKRTLFK